MLSAHVVLYIHLIEQWAHENKLDEKKTKKAEESDALFKVEHKHGDPVASLDCVPVYNSIRSIYVTTPLAKSTHQQVIPQQSTQNTASWELQFKYPRKSSDFQWPLVGMLRLPLQQRFLFKSGFH